MEFNSRGNGQGYKFQTHTVGGLASNITPNQDENVAGGGTSINKTDQNVSYGGVTPSSGDVLFKGEEVGKTDLLLGYLQTTLHKSPLLALTILYLMEQMLLN